MSSAASDELWDYATATYALPGVAACCLELQDKYHLDVNVLLYCLWLARREAKAVVIDWSGLLAQTSRWQTGVVSRLRALRRRLKALAVSSERALHLRDRLLNCELRAEAVEQAALPAWVGSPVISSSAAPSSRTAAEYLRAYCDALNVPLDAALTEALARLLARVEDVGLARARMLLVAAA